MLPGIRFLFGAIVLSMSILVFGFGAAALLRTAHEDFANAPVWRPTPEAKFAQNNEANPPVLALMRVDDAPREPAAIEPPALNNVPANVPADPTAAASPQPAPEKLATLPTEVSPSETAVPKTPIVQNPVLENPPQAEAATAPADATAATDETRIAATEQPSTTAQAPIPTQELPSATETAPASIVEATPIAPEAASGSFSTKIATLGGPPVIIASPKERGAKTDKDVGKKQQARRVNNHHRRRIALRARQAAQQAANPFAPPMQ